MNSLLDQVVRSTRTIFKSPGLASGLLLVATIAVFVMSRNEPDER